MLQLCEESHLYLTFFGTYSDEMQKQAYQTHIMNTILFTSIEIVTGWLGVVKHMFCKYLYSSMCQ